MFVSSCPLRVSLVGGSTDNPEFLKKYKKGSVISFASNLRVYTIIHEDIFGYNKIYDKFVINYSERECVTEINDIKNELVKECFNYFNVPKINMYLTSDILSSGSGLASSSSYIMSLIKSILVLKNKMISDTEICKIAMDIEKKINPLVGQQDFYGGCIGGLKKITFFDDKDPVIEYLDDTIFNSFDMFLLPTNVERASTNILKTIDIDKSVRLLDDVERLNESIITNDTENFIDVINQSWENKKITSPYICGGGISEIDSALKNNKDVLAHRLCGAGGGGYFLVFVNKNKNLSGLFKNLTKIEISKLGVRCEKI